MVNLMCTFSSNEQLRYCMQNLIENADITDKRILVFYNLDNPEQVYCIYNTHSKNTVSNTIKIHRRRQTRTLYTINTINYLKQIYRDIDWYQYRDSLVLFDKLNENHVKIIKLKLKLVKILV